MISRKSIAGGTAAIAGVAALGAGAAAVLAAAAMRENRIKRFGHKVVLITGSSRGLGLALAEEFGRLGARLVLCARNPEELDRARTLLLTRKAVLAADVITVPTDFRSIEETEAAVKKATDTFGSVDVLINNAGVISAGPVENQTAEIFHGVMDSNFFTAVHASLAVLPQMLERGDGSIVNIASIGGKVPVPHLLPYTASKFAVVGFSQGLHAELRSKGVHVLTVCPGLMRTGSHVRALFTGDAPREYRWFSLLANLPGMSASARSAARQIARGVMRKKAEIAITPQAVLAARLAQVFPGLTVQAMSLFNSALPDPIAGGAGQHGELKPGLEVRGRELFPASTIGWRAAKRYNELGG